MAVPLEIGICDLLFKLLAHALVLGRALTAAGTVSSGALQALAYHLYNFLVFVFLYSHENLLK